MSKNTLPRHVQLERAAKTRAILVAFMNKQREPTSIRDITNMLHGSWVNEGLDGTSVPYQLQQLAANKLIGVVKHGNQNMYFGSSTNTDAVIGASAPTVKKYKVKHEDVVPVQVSVEFVKSTGKVRFLLSGIVIEIGVV